MEREIEELAQAGQVHVIFDFSGLTHIDSSAIGSVVKCLTTLKRANGDLLLTTFDGHVLEFVGDRLKELPHPPSPPEMGFFGAVDETGQWWVTQRDFVGRWDGQRWIWTTRSRYSRLA